MPMLLPPILEILRNLGLVALLVLAYGFLLRAAGRRYRGPLMGLLFSIGAVVALSTPYEVAPGVIVDARGVILGLAGPFGGAVAAILAAASDSALRLWIGGAGAFGGIVGIVMAAAAGMLFRRLVPRPRYGYRTGPLAVVSA